ncbi:MAG: hypothetical protein HYW07_05935, partial [Candidatus Latescibacteria bacterium]|nr:hypothetical protein [Candidatus Latescibacterota bacterium]
MWCVLNSGELKAYADSQFHFLRSGVCGLAQDPSGAVWLTTWNEGVLRCDGDAFQVIQKTDKPLGGNPCLDSEGRLWFHGPRSVFMWGISCYDTTRFEVLQKEQGLPATDVNCLAEDVEGRIVVGTSAGIVVYDGHQFQPLE